MMQISLLHSQSILKVLNPLQDVDDGAEIDAWTFDELTDLVERFIKIESEYNYLNHEDEKKGNTENNTTKLKINKKDRMSLKKVRTSIKKQKDGPRIKYTITKELPKEVICETLPATMFTDAKVIIKVIEPIIKSSGIFSFTTVNYLLKTEPGELEVQRSYKDVLWLREQLQKEFPGHIVFCLSVKQIPPLDKKGDDNKTKEDILAKNMKALQHFFTKLQKDKNLRSSEITRKFLSVVNEAEFKAEKKAIEKITPKSLSEVKLLEGKFIIELNKHKNDIAKQISSYVSEAATLYQELIQNTNNMCMVMSVLSEAVAKNGFIFRELAKLNVKIEVSLELNELQATELVDTFNVFYKSNMELSILYEKQEKILKEQLSDFLPYYKEELESLKNV